ncbi:MAG TPA: patatin-like phospholipase family protein [Solirubrobacteraceae bacterium]|nr:patatin-like phospholipase family protein [Solirubrobacteraceae bacterium]
MASAITTRSASRVALVLPGGGARGAYEAGALSVLLPALEARGERVSIVCGTSVGAINAAVVGSLADRPAEEAAREIVARWLEMRRGDVLRRMVSPRLGVKLVRALGEAFEVPGMRLPSLLDPAPLAGSLDRWIDWMALHRNVKHGVIDAVCVVATGLSRGRPVAFTESTSAPPSSPPSSKLDYVSATLSGEHVRASAAIPLLFPPVEVTSPAAAADHYIDGGTRLNAPLAPALALGADRVVVIGFEPFAGGAERERVRTPRLADVTANVLDGLLVDQVADDLHRLAAINSFFVEGSSAASSARSYRAAGGRPAYRRVSYALVAPSRRGEIGELAAEVLASRYGGWRQLRDPDYLLLSRLLGNGPSRGELLSFLLFDERFVAELVALGRADAERWIARHPSFWCSDAAHDLDVAPASAASHDARTLDEFRALRRR